MLVGQGTGTNSEPEVHSHREGTRMSKHGRKCVEEVKRRKREKRQIQKGGKVNRGAWLHLPRRKLLKEGDASAHLM